MQIGKFDERIVIQSYSETRSANGGVIRNYSTAYTLWPQVIPKGGSESEEGKEKTARRICDFVIRKNGVTINETDRIVWNDETFNITTIDRAGTRLNEAYLIRGISKDND